MNAAQQASFDKWLEGRPKEMQAMARIYPPGTCIQQNGTLWYVCAYEDDGTLVVTDINPAGDYVKAMARRRPLCKSCMGNLHQFSKRHLN